MHDDDRPMQMLRPHTGLAELVCGTADGLTMEELLERSEAIVGKTLSQWRAAIMAEVSIMISSWEGGSATSHYLAGRIPLFGSIALDMEQQADAYGYLDIRTAAAELRAALIRMDGDAAADDDSSLEAQAESIAIRLVALRMRISEARRLIGNSIDLVDAA